MKKIILNVIAIMIVFGIASFTIPATSTAPFYLPENTQISFENFDEFYAVKYVTSGLELFTEETIGDSGTIYNPDSDADVTLNHKYWYPWQSSMHLEFWVKELSTSSWDKIGDLYCNVLNSDITSEMIVTLHCDYALFAPPPE